MSESVKLHFVNAFDFDFIKKYFRISEKYFKIVFIVLRLFFLSISLMFIFSSIFLSSKKNPKIMIIQVII